MAIVKKNLVVEVLPREILDRMMRLPDPRPQGTPAALASKIEDRIREQTGLASISSMPSLRDRAAAAEIEIDPITDKPYAR